MTTMRLAPCRADVAAARLAGRGAVAAAADAAMRNRPMRPETDLHLCQATDCRSSKRLQR